MKLRETRRRIEALAGDGRFSVASARTGEEPVPVAGLRFPDRETAAAAARLIRFIVSQYRWVARMVRRPTGTQLQSSV